MEIRKTFWHFFTQFTIKRKNQRKKLCRHNFHFYDYMFAQHLEGTAHTKLFNSKKRK